MGGEHGYGGGTAIETLDAGIASDRPSVDAVDADREEPGTIWALAALGVAGFACLLALLPVAVALRAFAPAPGLAAAVAAALGAGVLMTKMTAIVWCLAARTWSAHQARVAAAYAD